MITNDEILFNCESLLQDFVRTYPLYSAIQKIFKEAIKNNFASEKNILDFKNLTSHMTDKELFDIAFDYKNHGIDPTKIIYLFSNIYFKNIESNIDFLKSEIENQPFGRKDFEIESLFGLISRESELQLKCWITEFGDYKECDYVD